ncbi:SGNH/GDSL hydrolase family protein [Actinophytocola xanthii]|uniref:GDSL family lipase n=1 Tax=Actinophytocola xanthii TaxID=1912961 RepID=A0A1Q8CXY1_9PSEU|nr:SGNH/GDSL hydrolase family protein [Actinophytocola xanthii]OLF19199.1 GDSL family lipase [Actinophytocola xanthii]
MDNDRHLSCREPSRESADPYCLRSGESARLLAGHPWRRFAVLGDSVAEGLSEPVPGYGSAQLADRVAHELAAAAPDLVYLNLGHRGLRAREVAARQLGPALEFRPDLALVVCGANDAFPATYRPASVDAQLRTMVTALRAAGADVITVGLYNVSYSPSPAIADWLRPGLRRRMETLSEHTAAVAAELGTLHVNLTAHPAATDPGLFSGDGRHVNARGDAIALAETVRVLGAHLAAVRGARTGRR